MEQNGGVFKKKKVKFAQVSNLALRDENLSLKAKGLYSMIQSYITIENFTLYKNTLIKQCKDKEGSFNTAWKELKDNGYLVQEKKRTSNGSFYYEYDLLDEPFTTPQFSTPGFSTPGFSTPGFSTPGKTGVYNNTDFNNTDFNNTDFNNTDLSKGENSSATEKVEKEFIDTVIKKWNDVGLNVVRNIKGKRLDSLHARIKEYSKDDVLTVIENVKYSDFLKGNNNRNWNADIDWILKPNNFIKVLEGNYNKGKGIEKKNNSSSLNANSNYNYDINSLIEKMKSEV